MPLNQEKEYNAEELMTLYSVSLLCKNFLCHIEIIAEYKEINVIEFVIFRPMPSSNNIYLSLKIVQYIQLLLIVMV